MLRRYCLIIVSIFFLALILGGISEARRFGGGRSFGSRPSYQKSLSKPTSPQRDSGQSQMRPGGQASRPLGGFGGMLGGMLMGSLIGSLLFGGMRGFTGLGLLDMLVIGGGLFLFFRYLRSRRPAAEFSGSLPVGTGSHPYGGASGTGWMQTPPSAEEVSGAAPPIPPGFDQQEFLRGAEAAYNRLQDSWNRRDLEDIRQFTSPEVWEEIASQAREDLSSEKAEILLINSRLLEAKTEGEDTIASVYFDVLMRESAEEERPKQVREVWHFSRSEKTQDSFWRLEGIQQLEE